MELVRRFNRFYTERIGALRERYLGQRRPLAEARLLFEIGEGGRSLRDLRTRLGLDSGYLARLLRSLETQRLAIVEPDPVDRRSRVARLTPSGRRELRVLDARSANLVESLLAPLSGDERRRVVDAMAVAYAALRRSAITIQPVDPASPEARRCLGAYAEELAARFPAGYELADLVSAEEVRSHGVCMVARDDARAVGCGVLRELDAETAEIKHLWVDPDVRGIGLSRVLLEALEQAALARGKMAVRLDSHSALREAISLYRSAGYVQIPPYGSNPHAALWFEKRLEVVG